MPDLDGYETADADPQPRAHRRADADHLPDRQLPQRRAGVPRLLSRRRRLHLQAVQRRRSCKSKVAVFVELFRSARRSSARRRRCCWPTRSSKNASAPARASSRANEYGAPRRGRRNGSGSRGSGWCCSRASSAPARTPRRVNRLKDEFLATLSHELRTPLNAILGWSHLLTSRKSDPRRRSSGRIGVIRNNAMAQSQLIEDILDVVAIDRRQAAAEHRAGRLREVIGAALDSRVAGRRAKAHQDRPRTRPDIEPIAGDRDRLQQVVWNLALERRQVHAAREGGSTVSLEARRGRRA